MHSNKKICIDFAYSSNFFKFIFLFRFVYYYIF